VRSDLPYQYQARKTEGKIMGVISAHHSSGISHLELARKVGIDRKNLTPHMKRLVKKRLVIRRPGKQGKYYPATKDYRSANISAELLGSAAAGRVLLNEDFPVDSPLFTRKMIANEELETDLFIFANKVGAIITYLLIQSMNPSNKITSNIENDEEKDLDVERWVDDATSSLIPVLLVHLKESTSSLLTNLDREWYNSDGSVNLEEGGVHSLSYIYHRPRYTLLKNTSCNL
jgi:hypothetical protein